MELNPNLSKKICEGINQRKEIIITSYSIFDEINDIILKILMHSLKDFTTRENISPIFSSIKEVVTNALKANIKYIVADKNQTAENEEDLIKELKKVLTEKEIKNYTEKCIENHLFVTIHFIYNNPDHLKIKVVNPVPLEDFVLQRINSKIDKARQYDSLAHYYMENPDPMAEGMGLGISMIIVLLKGINMPVESFKVSTDGVSKTVAEFILPYNRFETTANT